MTRRRALAGMAAAGLLVCACDRRPTGPFPEAPVVLVSIDTLRSDRLPVYGYAKGATPTLDALAREGVVFDAVFSHCPLTLPAHASLFTGLTPPHHGVRDNLGFTLDPSHRTLASRFKERGLATGAAVSAYVLRRATGIAQGFDAYDDALETNEAVGALGEQQRDGAVAVESLGRWIEAQAGRRFFAVLHLYEPHAPYAPPPQHRDLADPYDGEVAYADELVGRLLARLRTLGLYDRAILAVTSDHGEGLMDHGEQEHGMFLYREEVQVPLIVRLPGGRRAGTRVAGVVAQVDIPATLLDLAGVPAAGMDGVSQRAALASGRAAARPVYAETFYPRYHFGWSELLAMTEERYRFIRAPRAELYDRERDPGETRNLAAERAGTSAAMAAWLGREAAAGEGQRPAQVPEETKQALQALGYVGGGVVDVPTGPLPDPKDKRAIFDAYRRALQARREGRLVEAAADLRVVLADSPGMLDAWDTLGAVDLALGRPDDAIAAFQEVVRRDPTNAGAHLALARIHGLAGRRVEAEREAELASVREPGRGFEALALVLLDRKEPEEAAAYARRSLAADPDRVMSQFVVARVAQRAGRFEEAASAYRKALEVQARRTGVVVRGLHAGLADCLARMGREGEAEAEFRAEIAEIPSSREARVGLAVLFRSEGRDGEAREALAGIVTANPHAGPDEYLVVARTLAELGDVPAARQWAEKARAAFPSDPRFR